MFIVRDYLRVPDMHQNVIPLFSMKEAGVNIKTTPKFQVEDFSIDDHSMCFLKYNLRTLLKLHGVPLLSID